MTSLCMQFENGEELSNSRKRVLPCVSGLVCPKELKTTQWYLQCFIITDPIQVRTITVCYLLRIQYPVNTTYNSTLVNFQTAYKMTSQPSNLAERWDRKTQHYTTDTWTKLDKKAIPSMPQKQMVTVFALFNSQENQSIPNF